MNYVSDSKAGRRDAITFVVCLLLAVIARADPLGVSPAVASALRESVLVPFIYLQDQTQEIRNRRAEFDRVIVQRDSLVMVANDLGMVRAENIRLRSLLSLSERMQFNHVAADVLHQVEQSEMSTIVVSAGERHGVRLWSPVIAPQGLIGYVFQVDRSTAMVYTWTHGEFRASGVAAGTDITGIVARRSGVGPATTMEFREVPHGAELQAGTQILTTGLGGVYPRGIPIGRAGELIDEQEGLSKTYAIEPAVYPAQVSHVLILLADSTRTIDLSPLFVEPGR